MLHGLLVSWSWKWSFLVKVPVLFFEVCSINNLSSSLVIGQMGRLGIDKVLDCFSLSISSCSCLCINSLGDKDEYFVERDSLIKSHGDEILRLRDVLEPKTVILRVSMHCYGCAKKVEKHIKKMEGVTSFKVDLESKKVVVMGDITPFEVLESVSKVKFAELCVDPC